LKKTIFILSEIVQGPLYLCSQSVFGFG